MTLYICIMKPMFCNVLNLFWDHLRTVHQIFLQMHAASITGSPLQALNWT